jgi:hypothetical protein
MTGISLYLKHVADLIDRCYEREQLLHANHIHSFAPALRFAEQLVDADAWAAHKAFKKALFKDDLWPNPDFVAWFNKARDEADERKLISGNAWEGAIEPFRKLYTRMLYQARDELQKLRRPYEEERDELFREEVDRFATVISLPGQWEEQKRTAFCIAVFAAEEPATGLRLDKRLSTKASPVFSKHMAQHWKVSIHFDGKHLNSPFHAPSVDPETGRNARHVFPSVDPWIGVRPLKPSKDEARKRAAISFDWVFPIRQEGCVGGYRSFASLPELEAILRIYIKMFQLIEPEFEAALSADRAA